MTSATQPAGVAATAASPQPTEMPPTRPLRPTAQRERGAAHAVLQRTVFVDTEFTQLGPDALLLSVGMVADTARPDEFYGEVTDPQRLSAAGRFARTVVTPQFGKLPNTGCSYRQLGVRIAAFLRAVVQQGPRDACTRIAFESDYDWALIVRALTQSCPQQWRDLAPRLTPTNVYNMTGFAAGERAALAYFQRQATAAISRHHALCDARALQIACRAADADTRAVQDGVRPATVPPPPPQVATRTCTPDMLA